MIDQSILDSVASTVGTPTRKANIITISGIAGSGKTTLSQLMFKNPMFIRFEDGLKSIESMGITPNCFSQLITNVNDVDTLWNQLYYMAYADHNFDALVIDSVTQAEILFTEYLLAHDPNKSNNMSTAYSGYSIAYRMLAQLHGKIREWAEIIASRGISVVFIAHSKVDTIDPPDNPPYNMYSLRLQDKSAPHYVDNVDMVAFVTMPINVNKEAKKAYESDGERVVRVTASAFYVAKNRFNIDCDLKYEKGINPFNNII